MTVAFRFTSADLDALPDLEGVRWEIIDGDLLVSTPVDIYHQHACGQVLYALMDLSAQEADGVAVMAPGLVFDPENDVVPDVVWISRTRLAQALDDRGHLRLPPELIVEVLSPGRVHEVRDRELKLALYSRQNVQEYWIVNWQARLVDVYRPGPVGLQLVATLRTGDVLTSPLLPALSCPVANLWLETGS